MATMTTNCTASIDGKDGSDVATFTYPATVPPSMTTDQRSQRTANGDLSIDQPDELSVAPRDDNGAMQPRRAERPKSAWKSRQRQPRFTDETIVSESVDLDAEIDTLILDDSFNNGRPINGLKRSDVDVSNEPSQLSIARHSGLLVPEQRHHIADKLASQLADPDDWLPSNLNPLTPRAWQPKEDPAVGTAASSSLQLELRLALDDQPDSDVPSLDASGSGLQRQLQHRRHGSDVIIGTPPSGGLSSGDRQVAIVNGADWPNAVSAVPSMIKSNSGEHEQLSMSAIVSGEALASIHKKVLEKYQQQQQHVAVSASVTASYSKHARYTPTTPPKATAPSLIQSIDEVNSDLVGENESRIPVPVRKLAPIDKRIKQRGVNRKHSERRRAKHGEEQGTVIPSTETSFVENDVDGRGGGRKVRLKPLIGRRAKELFNETVSLPVGTTHEETLGTSNSETMSIDRGTTFITAAGDRTSGEVLKTRTSEITTAQDHTLTSSGPTSTSGLYIPVEDVPGATNLHVEQHLWKRTESDNNNNSSSKKRPAGMNSRMVGDNLADASVDTVPLVSTYPPYRADVPRGEGVVAIGGHVIMPVGQEQQRHVTGNSRDTQPFAGDPLNHGSDDVESRMMMMMSGSVPADDLYLREFSLYPSRPRQRIHSNQTSMNTASVTTRRVLGGRFSDPAALVVVRDQPSSLSNVSISSDTNDGIPVAPSKSDPPVQIEAASKSGQPVVERRPRAAPRDSTESQLPSRSIVEPVVGNREASLLPVSTAVKSWDPQYSLTDMWKQLQSNSKIQTAASVGSVKTTGADRVPSYMR